MRALLTGVPPVQAFRGPWLRGIPRQGAPGTHILGPGGRRRLAMHFSLVASWCWVQKGMPRCAQILVCPMSFRCSLHCVLCNVDRWTVGTGGG